MSRKSSQKQGAGVQRTGATRLTEHRIILAIILAYSCVALVVAFHNRAQNESAFAVSRLFRYAQFLQSVTNAVQRDSFCLPLSAYCRNVAEQLPPSARVFMTSMVGKENGGKLGYYYFMVNYLFPREVALALNQELKFTGSFYEGRSPTNTGELIQAGYHLAINVGNDNQISVTPLARLQDAPVARTPDICPVSDQFIAGLLPPLIAVFGLWVFARLFAFERSAMAAGEKAACGLALGCLFVGQFLFGAKLFGVPGVDRVVFWFLLIGTLALAIRHFKSTAARLRTGFNPQAAGVSLLLLPHVIFFSALLWLAGLEGLKEFDAVAGWTLKAKIIHLSRGHEIVRWFSEPRFSHAHLDYPVLIPTLQAFTYGVLGRVNEFVIKYWPTWMIVAVIACLLSLCGFPKRNRILAPVFTLAILCMPLTMQFLRTEGATGPSLLFTSLGCIQCSLAVAKSDKQRLWLGFLLLLGAAMTKFEGIIVLFLWIAAALCLPQTRRMLAFGRREWIIVVLAIGLVIPYVALKTRIPQLHPDQLAFQTIAKHPLTVAREVPTVFGVMMARQCVDENLAAWSVSKETGTHWSGKWSGWQSLINTFNLGWGWLCMILSIALIRWRATRQAAIVLVLVVGAFLAFIAAVYCGLPYMFNDLQWAIDITTSVTGGRHLAPVTLAWGLSLVALAVSASPDASTAPAVQGASAKPSR